MYAISVKVGETMKTFDNQTKNGKRRKCEDSRPVFLVRWSAVAARHLTRTLCIMALKLKLKETGSSIRCEGNINISGTKNIKVGNGCYFNKNVQLHTTGRGYIHLGENVKLDRRVIINSSVNITIEDNTYLGEGVVIQDCFSESEKEIFQKDGKSVYIGKDVWIGKGTQIHAGVTIGHGCTISANSVVIRSMPPRVIAGGAPAKVIKEHGHS